MPTIAGFEDLFDRGREVGYVLMQDIEDLYEEENEVLDTGKLAIVRQFLEFSNIDLLDSESEIVRPDDDVEGTERADADGGSIQADPVWQYLKDIHDIPLLTAAQEVDLAQRIESGDETARQQFTLSNLRVNATSLTIGSGVPPSITETIFVSGASVVPTALAAVTTGFAQNGLGATSIRNGAGTGYPAANLTSAGISTSSTNAVPNNFVICNANTIATAFVVQVRENFASAFHDGAGAPAVAVNGGIVGASAAGGSVRNSISLHPSSAPICAASSSVCHRPHRACWAGCFYCREMRISFRPALVMH